MKLRSRFLLAFLPLLLFSCIENDGSEFRIITYNFDFSTSEHDWKHGFADYPAGVDDSAFYELKYEYTKQPNSNKKAIMLSGNNHSDDLFMYIKYKMTGLQPNTQYTLTFEVEFLSEAEKASVGAGGSPGESVFLKVGATNMEPKTVIENEEYVMNIDKGNQATSGVHMIVIGDIAVPENSNGFVSATRSNSPYNNDNYDVPVIITTNANGEGWLIVGTDSGYEGITTLYFTKVLVVLSQVK